MRKKGHIAANALTTHEMQNAQGLLLGKIRRDETLKINGAYEQLMVLLRSRATELELEPTLSPSTVTDWLALDLFAQDRRRFKECCYKAEQEKDAVYRIATFWIEGLMNGTTGKNLPAHI